MMRSSKKCRSEWEDVLNLHDGTGDPTILEPLRVHLKQGCAACETRLSEIGRLQEVMRQGELTSAPDHVLSRARDLFRERFVKPVRRSLLATLVFDSRSRMALSGARGAEGGQVQALYSTPEHDIDLWQERTPDGRWYV